MLCEKNRVLVGDDNAVNLQVACARLTWLGYPSQTALNGREAVEAVTKQQLGGLQFGAALMDVNMPRMNGLQAPQEIRRLLGAALPAIIGLTAGAASENRSRCLDASVNDYLTKLLYVAGLMQALERWLDQPSVGVLAMQSMGMALEAQAKTGVMPVSAIQQLKTLRGYWGGIRVVLDAWL